MNNAVGKDWRQALAALRIDLIAITLLATLSSLGLGAWLTATQRATI